METGIANDVAQVGACLVPISGYCEGSLVKKTELSETWILAHASIQWQ